MANWNVGSRGTQPKKVSDTAPKKTPRSYESYPFGSTHKEGKRTDRMSGGSRRGSGRGMKNPNSRMKTPQR